MIELLTICRHKIFVKILNKSWFYTKFSRFLGFLNDSGESLNSISLTLTNFDLISTDVVKIFSNGIFIQNVDEITFG